MAIQLQGDPNNLQGNTQPLQGAATPLQGSGMPVAAPVVPTAQNQAVVAPQAAPAVTDLSGKYANVGGTIYDKATGQGFSTPQQFFQAAGVNSFNGLKYDTAWTPGQVQQPAQQQAQSQTLAPYTDPNQRLATNAGLSGATTDDYLKMLGSQTAITPEERASIYQQLGIPDLAASAFAAPSQSTTQVFNDAYAGAGLADVKQQIMTLNDQINKARTDLTTATGSVNENPWLSEASRVGRLGRLQDQAQSTIGNLIDQQTQYKDLYAQGLNDINGMVTRHTTDFTTNQQLNAQKLTYLVQQAEGISTATQAAKTAKLARYLPDYLAAKTQAATPATVQFPNGASYSYDKTSGQWQQLTQPQAPFSSTLGPDGLPTSFNPNTGTYGVSTTPVSGLTTPAAVNNNPGNLRDPITGAWQKFATPQEGFQALVNDLQGKQTGNTRTGLNANSTLQQFTSVYAPAGDGSNNPAAYAQDLAKKLGVSVDTPIGQIPTQQLAAAVASHEDPNYWNAINQAQTQSTSTIANLPPLIQKYTQSLSSVQGSEYINLDRIPSAQVDAIKIQAAGSKVPVLTGAEVGGLKSIDVIFQNLADLSNLSNQLLSSGLAGRLQGLTGNQLTAAMQTDPRFANFQLARDTAIKTVQALAGGTGSGLRLNLGEIETAAANLPNITDNLGYAQEKISGLKRLLTNQLSETLPNIQQDSGSGSGGAPDLSGLF